MLDLKIATQPEPWAIGGGNGNNLMRTLNGCETFHQGIHVTPPANGRGAYIAISENADIVWRGWIDPAAARHLASLLIGDPA